MIMEKVLEEGISRFLINKVYKDLENIAERVKELLELNEIDIGIKRKVLKGGNTTELSARFNIGEKKYDLYIFCFILLDKALLPYSCLVFKVE